MRKQIETAFVILVGVVLIFIGIISIFVPIIPGIVLIILGIYLLSLKSTFVKTRLDKFVDERPHLKEIIEKIYNKWRSFFSKIGNFFKKNN